MLGDTAVAVNPRDPRAEALRGRMVRLPITGREIPIVEDDYVVLPRSIAEDLDLGPEAIADPKAALATGFLKVTPAHDPNDWEIGLRHELEVINEVAGLMSLLEGHGDITMDRAGKDLIPSQERFARVLRNRRQGASGFTKVFQKRAGLEAKMKQYAEGEHFIQSVEGHGGMELLDKAWAEPANVPSIAEIRDPSQWIERVGVSAPAA